MTNTGPQDSANWPTPDAPHPAWSAAPPTGAGDPTPALRAVPSTPADADSTAQGVRPVSYGSGPDHSWTVMSETKRVGLWQVPQRLSCSVVMGSVRLDLREAELTGPVTTIEVRGLMGEAKIIVPEACRVECIGSPFMGEFQVSEPGSSTYLPADAPLVRVTGSMVMGSVNIYRTAAPVGAGSFAVDGIKGVRNRRRGRGIGA